MTWSPTIAARWIKLSWRRVLPALPISKSVPMDFSMSFPSVTERFMRFRATALAAGELGVPYSADLSVSGGVEPYTIEVARGELPAGLGIVDGTIAGTPAQRRGSSFTLRVADQRGSSLTRRFHLTVVGAVAINNRNLPAGRAGRRYRARLGAGAGKKPYGWSLTGGTLPAGLSFAPATASIAGTPLAAAQTDLTFQVTDSLGGASQRTLTLVIR